MNLVRLLPLATSLTLLHGCSGHRPDTLTCDWLVSSDNCWQNTVLVAKTCLPPESEIGVLSADNSTCRYANGSTVTFTPAVLIPPPLLALWNFTITDTNGGPCLHYEDGPRNGVEPGDAKLVVAGDQTVAVTRSGLAETITCPDGAVVHTSNRGTLFSCSTVAQINEPGLSGSSSLVATDPPFVIAYLTAAGSNVKLFDCRRPAP
jgi:hypothetical protein